MPAPTNLMSQITQETKFGECFSREFVDTITKDILGSRIFVFSPKGEIKNLPKGATAIDYAYMIHTEIGNSIVAAKVNGNLVTPTHVLANAEVVEIITYSVRSSKSAFERHKQWLQHAKTRSARHKIMKFLREQAALSAYEIMEESVKDFIAESEDDSKQQKLTDVSNIQKGTPQEEHSKSTNLTTTNDALVPFQNGSIQSPKINGKHRKYLHNVNLSSEGEMLLKGNGVARMIYADLSKYTEVLRNIEKWQTTKVVSWHNAEGHSIQWLSIICIDRKGMMAEVTTTLASVDTTICSCVAEVDRRRGIGVMLFHVEGSPDDLANACSRIDTVLGILNWSTGCSWPCSAEETRRFYEC